MGSLKHANISTNYSGTVTMSGSASIAMRDIKAMKDFMTGHPVFQNARDDKVLEPIVRILDFAQEVIEKQEEELIKEKPEHKDEYRQKIKELEGIIDANEEEPIFQSFFENNPNLLIAEKIKVEPKPNFGGELKPDFMIEASNSCHWIIEIEKPAKVIFRKDDQPTAEFTQAEKQIRDYLKWARDNLAFLKKRGWTNLSVENMRGLLIIGRKSNLTGPQIRELQAINHDRSNYEVKTFDDILNENLVRLDNWERMEGED